MSAILTGLGALPLSRIGGTPADPALAGASDGLVYGAIAAYAVALVAFAVDLSGGRRTAGRDRAADGADVTADVPVDVTVGAGALAAGTSAAGAPTTVGSGSVGSGSEGSGSVGSGSVGSGSVGVGLPGARSGGSGPVGSGSRTAGVPGGTASSSAAHRAGGIGSTVFVLATLLHLAAVVARGLSVQRVPWSDAYEFAVTGALAVSLVYVVLLRRGRQWRWLGTFVVLPVALTLVLATQLFPTEASALSPALQSVWLVVHVSIAILSSALFTIGFSLAVVQLVQHRAEAAAAAGGRASRFLERVPAARQLEQTSFQLHAVAFVLWTFTVVAGAIWAAEAWGRYWGWDPKEVWSFVIWTVYAAYLHARSTAGWAGPRSAWIAVLGFVCLLFNFLGVNYLFVGNHSYAL